MKAARLIWDSWESGNKINDFPRNISPKSRKEAYEIQKNLEDIGLGEFSTLIEDPVRDRRKVVNAARDLLENNIRQLDQLNYKKNIKFDNGRFSARSISNKHDEHLNSITDKIEKLQVVDKNNKLLGLITFKDITKQKTHTIHLGHIVDGTKIYDQVLLSIFVNFITLKIVQVIFYKNFVNLTSFEFVYRIKD